MNNELYIKIDSIEANTCLFNTYTYRFVKGHVGLNEKEKFEFLFNVDDLPPEGCVVRPLACKLVRVNYDSEIVEVAIRIDRYEIHEPDTKISKHLTVPIIGMIIRSAKAKLTLYGPDKVKFLMLSIQMKDADKKPYMLPIIGFNNKAVLLDSFVNTQIITGFVSLKHKKQGTGYELALVAAEPYTEF